MQIKSHGHHVRGFFANLIMMGDEETAAGPAADCLEFKTQRRGPSSLLFSRQGLAHQSRTAEQLANIEKGGYILVDSDNPQAIIIATGSEVALAVEAQSRLADQGISTRVVSMPSTNVFDRRERRASKCC